MHEIDFLNFILTLYASVKAQMLEIIIMQYKIGESMNLTKENI